MKTVTEQIRQGLLDRAGVPPKEQRVRLSPDHLMQIHWNTDFHRLQKQYLGDRYGRTVMYYNAKFLAAQKRRMCIGYFRYGSLNKEAAYDYVGSIIDRAKAYKDTGNDEYLVDIANIAMVEFTCGVHPKKHFKATDDGIHAKEL